MRYLWIAPLLLITACDAGSSNDLPEAPQAEPDAGTAVSGLTAADVEAALLDYAATFCGCYGQAISNPDACMTQAMKPGGPSACEEAAASKFAIEWSKWLSCQVDAIDAANACFGSCPAAEGDAIAECASIKTDGLDVCLAYRSDDFKAALASCQPSEPSGRP